MSEEAEVSRKIGKAFQMLVLQKHRYPGVKGWELRKVLGKDYTKYIDVLNIEIEKLGLTIKSVFEEEEEQRSEIEKLDSARFFVVFKDSLLGSEAGTLGLRIDDIAVLATSIAYMVPRQGKVRRKDLEQMLREKFPKWKVQLNLDRFIRRGYLLEKDDMLYIGWRTKAEVDQKTLLNLILSEGTSSKESKC